MLVHDAAKDLRKTLRSYSSKPSLSNPCTWINCNIEGSGNRQLVIESLTAQLQLNWLAITVTSIINTCIINYYYFDIIFFAIFIIIIIINKNQNTT